MDDRLTILLTLRGRHLHTLRWMWHANKIKLPFHVIIADGDVHPAIDRLLSSPELFPNLSWEYHRYADKSFSDFYFKCAESVGRVKTPYTMISDNDDFLMPSGLMKCMEFLEGEPEFVCAAGGIPGFSTAVRDDRWNTVLGPVDRWAYRCHWDGSYASRNIDQPLASQRVLEEIRNFLSIYYCVYRTDALRTIMTEIDAFKPSDLLIHEFYAALRAVTLGKVASSKRYFSYFRQGNSSSRFSFEDDWVKHLLRSRFPQDFQTMAAQIAAAATNGDEESSARLEADMDEAFAGYLRRMLAGTLMRHRFPRLFTLKQRLLRAKGGVALPRAWKVAGQDRRFWRSLAADGATPQTVADHRGEIGDIERTLDDGTFAAFVERHAPELVAAQD